MITPIAFQIEFLRMQQAKHTEFIEKLLQKTPILIFDTIKETYDFCKKNNLQINLGIYKGINPYESISLNGNVVGFISKLISGHCIKKSNNGFHIVDLARVGYLRKRFGINDLEVLYNLFHMDDFRRTVFLESIKKGKKNYDLSL